MASARKSIKKPTIETKCIVPGCDRTANNSRKCCSSCYTTARDLVRSGVTTWEELEENHIVAAAHETPRNPVKIALEAVRAKTKSKSSKLGIHKARAS